MWFDNSSVHPESHCCNGEFCICVSINLCDLSTSTSSSPYVSTLAGMIDCVLCVSTCTNESEHVNEWMCVLWKDRKGCLIVQEMGVSLLYNFSCKSLVYVMELYVCLCVCVSVWCVLNSLASLLSIMSYSMVSSCSSQLLSILLSRKSSPTTVHIIYVCVCVNAHTVCICNFYICSKLFA